MSAEEVQSAEVPAFAVASAPTKTHVGTAVA